jgi:catechol-2,3-dioxygenase
MILKVSVPATAKDRGRVAPIKFAHIVFRTSRFEDMLDWYKTVLEAEVVIRTDFLSFLTYDDEHHRIGIANIAGLSERSPHSSGVEHCAFTYASVDDLVSTYERLRFEGIEPYWCINHGPTLSFYYRDPDMNQVELQIDIFDNTEAVNEWFLKSDFDINPIGVKFDPQEFVRRFKSGVALDKLLKRPFIEADQVGEQFPDA